MSPTFRDAVALRRLNTMRTRSEKAQAARAEVCKCPTCQAMGSPIGAILASLGQVATEVEAAPMQPTKGVH